MHIFSLQDWDMKAKAVALPCVTLIAVACNKMSCLSPFVFRQILSFKGGFFAQRIHVLWIEC